MEIVRDYERWIRDKHQEVEDFENDRVANKVMKQIKADSKEVVRWRRLRTMVVTKCKHLNKKKKDLTESESSSVPSSEESNMENR